MTQFMSRRGRVALAAMVAIGIAIAISSFGIVRAERGIPTKTFNCSSGTACVTGSSMGSTTWGVYGVSNSADGVHGRTNSTSGNSAVAGFSRGTGGSGQGVYGWSSNGYGVEGVSTGGEFGAVGVEGSANYTGVYGLSNKGFGVVAESSAPESDEGYTALLALGESAKTEPFIAYNTANEAQCEVDPKANLTCTGKIGAPSFRERHQNRAGQHVLSYSTQSATATIEDVGTARISGGVANVQIEPSFASVMGSKWYYVFLTPLGETRGLYVSMKTTTAFQVREFEHGRSSLEFDYRIVAHPFDADSDRLPLAPEISKPKNIIRPAH